MFHIEDIEHLRVIDFEVKGHSYDGGRISWKMGFEGAAGDPGSDDCFFVVTAPCFGGLVSRRRRPSFLIHRKDVCFEDGVVNVLSYEPTQFGIIKNLGNLPILITGAEIRGTDARSFYVLLTGIPGSHPINRASRNYRNDYVITPLYELPNRGPILIAPGDYLAIGGSFLPEREGEHNAWIEVRTNTPQSPIQIQLTGNTMDSQAIGNMVPDSYDLGRVSIGSSYSRNALITSDGPTPLLITSLKLERDPRDIDALGFSISGTRIIEGVTRKQVQPGHSLPFVITYRPLQTGRASTTLVAETNAGTLRMSIRAEGVRQE